MSLFGKILVVLNLLGAAALAVLMSMAYARQQVWSQAVYRNEVMKRGLPLDDNDHYLGDEPLVQKLGEENLKEVCVTEPIVETQEKEVERVQGDVQDRVKKRAAGSKRAEIELLAQVLLPQSLSNAQREEYLACRTHLATDATLAELQKSFKEASAAAAVRAQDKKLNIDFRHAFDQELHTRLLEPARPFVEIFHQHYEADPKKPFEKLFEDTIEQLLVAFRTRLDDAFGVVRGERIVARLVTLPGGVLWVPSQGGSRFFGSNADGSFKSPPGDTGTLVKKRDGSHAYTRKEQDKDVELSFSYQGVDSHKIEELERRKQIARLLFLLVDVLPDDRAGKDLALGRTDLAEGKTDLVNSKAYQRYINIVGLQRAMRQMRDQAQVLQRIASELDASIQVAALDQEVVRDRSRFIQEHQALLDEVRVRADEARAMEKYLKQKEAQTKAQLDNVNTPRRKNVKAVEDELDASRKQTAEKMAALRLLSQSLFDKRVEVRDALEQNYQYERMLHELEANR